MSGNVNVNRQASNFGTKFAQLALSFHLTQQFQERGTPCGHRPRGREESDHAGKSLRLAARPKDRVILVFLRRDLRIDFTAHAQD